MSEQKSAPGAWARLDKKRAWTAVLALLVVSVGVGAWFSSSEVSERLEALIEELPENLGGHMRLSFLSLALGVAISLPLGIWVSEKDEAREWVLGIAGVLQTVPSLALLALMVPVLGGEIGFWPAFAAMTLYSLAPVLSNTVTGFREVNRTLVEAGTGLGMREGGWRFWSRAPTLRWSIKWPNARANVLTGVRLATVMVVGSATLATPVGDRTLGNYIFIGLNTRDYFQVIFGCVAAAALAIVFDQLIRLGEYALKERRPRLGWLAVAGLLLLSGVGLYRPVARAISPPPSPVVLGTQNYTEQFILGEVMRRRLEGAGFHVDRREALAQQVALEALGTGRVDVGIDYTGSIWEILMKKDRPVERREMARQVADYLRETYDIECLGPLGFENAYAIAIRRSDATRYRIRTLADLSRHAPRMTIGGDLQFFQLSEWRRARDAYKLRFREAKALDPTLMYGAARDGQVDVIVAYTSDARIRAFDLVVLEDPEEVFPKYDAILLVSRQALAKPGLAAALRPLVGAIDDEKMRRANGRVDIDRKWTKKAGAELDRALSSNQAGPR